MIYLSLVTLLWAFSFSLIGVYLAGQVDVWFSVLTRVALATLVLLPFLKLSVVRRDVAIKLMLLGAIQLGIMYVFYYHSFLFLTVPEVLLFTVMTPIYITLINDLLDKKFRPNFFISAAIAVFGAVTIRYQNVSSDYLFGLLMVQGANLCFAIGQVGYKRVVAPLTQVKQHHIFAFFFIGAFIVALACYGLFGNVEKLPTTSTQWGILIYLGIVASGLGYFAWNKGATLVNVGTLAVMNNLLIPAGILVNLIIWNRDADIARLLLGGSIILFAIWVNSKLGNKGGNTGRQ